MNIPIVRAVGHGRTELSAFDSALVAAGVADRNLIFLSSVLPPGSVVVPQSRIADCPGGWGDRLYCVMSQMTTRTPGVDVHAGIGYVHDDTGRGLLVEHHGHVENDLIDLIHMSLDDMVKSRGIDLPHRGVVTASASCRAYTGPACALVVAVFEAAPWVR